MEYYSIPVKKRQTSHLLLLQKINLNEKDGLKKTTLGKRLENPYSVDNMRKALDNLKKANTFPKARGINTELEIKATHLYIRFKPKNERDLDIIKKDTTLILFDHPMDYEISEQGDFYHDPEIPEDTPTYQYTSVKVEKILPDVPYEILENLYLPYDEDSEDVKIASRSSSLLNSTDIADVLEEESLKITGKFEESNKNEIAQRGWFSRRKKWRPSGQITLWDTTLGRYVGVEGVKVRAGRWFKWKNAYTNFNGSFSLSSRFKRRVRYKMDWERHHFALRSGFWASAEHSGPYKKGSWSWQIENGDRHQYYGTIFRAAYHYYYKDIKGLRRPPKNNLWKSQLRIRASRKEDAGKLGSHLGVRRVWGLGDGVYIYTHGMSSSQTYATTIHELAHASHWNFQRINHNVSKTILAESWARGVEWELTRMVYPRNLYTGRNNSDEYTLVVADMIDDRSTDNTNRGFNDNRDQVSGYTIRQLEDALKGINTWNGWRDNIRDMYSNPTEQNLNTLFSAYE